MGSYIILIIIIALFFLLTWYSKKSNNKRLQQQEEIMRGLQPGDWVYTRVGFYGKFVDFDGDVLILETPGGIETYWNKIYFSSKSDPPLANDNNREIEGSDSSD